MTLDPTAFDREAALGRLAAEPFDVLVVGGGVTGAGVALDAAARGLSTALVERGDLASGTSSKSSKLIHGGLRYLQQREYLLVYENLAERQLLLHNAPHLVSPLPFLIPLFGRDGVVNKAVARAYSVALWLYDLTGGLRIGKRHRRIGVDETLAHMPTLRPDRLVAGFVYYDAEADDARLTLTLARTAALDFGAAVATYAPVTGFHQDGSGRVDGAVVSPLRRPGTGGATSGAIEVRAPVHSRRRRLPPGRAQHLRERARLGGRRGGRVGRPAPPHQGRHQRAHGRPVPPPPGVGLRRRAGERHRRQADHLPQDGFGHR